MKHQRIIAIALLTLLSTCGLHAQEVANPSSDGSTEKISHSIELIQAHRYQQAIAMLESVELDYEATHDASKTQFFSARDQREALFYLITAAADKKEAKVVSSNWSYAYYYDAYALVELQQLDQAELKLEKATALSPKNSLFLSELAHIHQLKKHWSEAEQGFQNAASAAAQFAPDASKNTELARAWRGLGYVYVEQGRLADAEKIYRKCLKLNEKDKVAEAELGYVLSLSVSKAASGASP